MTDTPLTDRDRAALILLGLTLTGGSAWSSGTMTAEVTPHGCHHLRVVVALLSGNRLSSFIARSRLVKGEPA